MLRIEVESSSSLRKVLLADGLTSSVTGLGMAMLPGPVSRLIRAPSALLVAGVGVGLVLFGLAVIRMARSRAPGRGGTLFTVAANLAWVLGSTVVVLAGGLNGLGRLGLVLVGLVVLGFAILELRLLPSPLEETVASLDQARA